MNKLKIYKSPRRI